MKTLWSVIRWNTIQPQIRTNNRGNGMNDSHNNNSEWRKRAPKMLTAWFHLYKEQKRQSWSTQKSEQWVQEKGVVTGRGLGAASPWRGRWLHRGVRPVKTRRAVLHTYRFCILLYAHCGSTKCMFEVFILKYRIMGVGSFELHKQLSKIKIWSWGTVCRITFLGIWIYEQSYQSQEWEKVGAPGLERLLAPQRAGNMLSFPNGDRGKYGHQLQRNQEGGG